MTNGLETLERDVLERLRRQYESRGYKFLAEQNRSDIPKFLEGYIPDAIAIGTDEKVIIEVKSTEQSANQSATVRFLASEVPKHKGWRFDLVVADTGTKAGDLSSEPDVQQLRAELKKITNLVESDDHKAALVLAWALLEAVTRRLILNRQFGEPKRYLPRTIIETLVSEGFAEDEIGDKLLRLADTRNRLVHGFTRLNVDKKDVDFLVQFIGTLMAGIS